MSGNLQDKVKKELCLKSGNRCALPNCHQLLVIDVPQNGKSSIIAVFAHIKGENVGSARYDPNFPVEERNGFRNLIVVYPTCHKIIDDQEEIYTIEYLVKLKKDHEEWIMKRYEEEVINVTFKELSEVMHYIADNASISSGSLELIPPKEKIIKNDLSPKVEKLIVMGLTKANQVKSYINSHFDLEFANKLVNGFSKEYKRLKYVEELEADDLFFALLDFSSDYKSEFLYKAAGLSILSYLFEKCEVFEK